MVRLLIAMLLGAMLASSVAQAGNPNPTYRTIAPGPARPLRGYQHQPGHVEPLPARPYAWGWFGAAPRSYGGFQRGYYGELWWSSRSGW